MSGKAKWSYNTLFAVAKMDNLGIALIGLGLALLCSGLVFLVLDRRARLPSDDLIEEAPEQAEGDLQMATRERGES
jgi:hypothetical protein